MAIKVKPPKPEVPVVILDKLLSDPDLLMQIVESERAKFAAEVAGKD